MADMCFNFEAFLQLPSVFTRKADRDSGRQDASKSLLPIASSFHLTSPQNTLFPINLHNHEFILSSTIYNELNSEAAQFASGFRDAKII